MTNDIKIEPPEFVGTIPLREDITVLPSDDPKKLRLGWTITESTGPYYLPSDDNSCYETDKVDEFLGSHGKHIDDKDLLRSHGWGVIKQLEFLNGQPWNNLALNYVMALRPSSIRVTTGMCTCDAVTWRVTVILEEDKRTIKYIEQECNVGSIGAECGHDLRLKLEQQKTGKKIPKFDVTTNMVNPDALAKVELTPTILGNNKS